MKGLTYWWAKVQDSIKICFLRDPPTRAQLREQTHTFSNKIKYIYIYPLRLEQRERKEIRDKTKSKILLSIHWLNLLYFYCHFPQTKDWKGFLQLRLALAFDDLRSKTSTRRFPPQKIKIMQLHRWCMMKPIASTNTVKIRRNLNSKGTEIITLIQLNIFKEHNPPQLHHPSPSTIMQNS